MFLMSDIKFELLEDVSQIQSQQPMNELVGLDIETTGLNMNKDSLVGLSFWIKDSPIAYFVTKQTLDSNQAIKDYLKELFIKNIVVCHNSPFDICFLQKEGFEFGEIYDTLILCNLLQFQSSKLKDVALEMGVVEYEEVIYIQDLFKEIGIKENEVLDFSKLDLHDPRVLQYVGNDAVFPVKLYPILFDMIVKNTGRTPEEVTETLEDQFISNKALLEWNKDGLTIDKSVLENSINSFEEDYNKNKEILTKEVREMIEKHLGIQPKPQPMSLFV